MIPDYEFSTSAELLCKMDIVDKYLNNIFNWFPLFLLISVLYVFLEGSIFSEIFNLLIPLSSDLTCLKFVTSRETEPRDYKMKMSGEEKV